MQYLEPDGQNAPVRNLRGGSENGPSGTVLTGSQNYVRMLEGTAPGLYSTRGTLATAIPEADRQREKWNLSNEAQRSLRRTAGLNMSEPICSVVKSHPGNWDRGCAEPLFTWRRQYRIPLPALVSEHPGVTGQACSEGYPREEGRSRISPMTWYGYSEPMESSTVSGIGVTQFHEVTPPISRSEMAGNGVREVRQVYSMYERLVMGVDVKRPYFCCASSEG